ncbi:MAG: dihydropteroate synthase [Elusimicrobia bacterium]|nr:dihydropteroate synthase [Elusimicrobiota bacterium]
MKKIICGILNITPDSFSDGGLYMERNKAVQRAIYMYENGAGWVDIGGQSSRPGAEPIGIDEEINRVIPVISDIRRIKSSVVISVDTYYPEVAVEAIKHGADVINDITGLRDERMVEVVLKYNKPVVIMHMKGDPLTMQKNPQYDDVVDEIYNFFKNKINFLNSKGFDKIIIDPGIGFGKSLEHNITIIKNLFEFKKLGFPIMIGPSRKSFIGHISGEKDPQKRLAGTIASCLSSYEVADIFRVHDVCEIKQAFDVYEKISL